MKLHYYPETDSLYIELNDAVSSETREIVSGLNVDFDHASRKLDLTRLEATALPLSAIIAA